MSLEERAQHTQAQMAARGQLRAVVRRLGGQRAETPVPLVQLFVWLCAHSLSFLCGLGPERVWLLFRGVILGRLSVP